MNTDNTMSVIKIEEIQEQPVTIEMDVPKEDIAKVIKSEDQEGPDDNGIIYQEIVFLEEQDYDNEEQLECQPDENDDCVIKIQETQQQIMTVELDTSEIDMLTNIVEPTAQKCPDNDVVSYREIVFLEEGEFIIEEDLDCLVNVAISTQEIEVPVPKKSKRSFPKKNKQYSSEMLRKCVDTVIAEKMTAYEASEVFKIPRKTIVAKVKERKEDDQDPHKEETYKFISEIKMILTYTNATPFKSKVNRFYCMYCPYEGVLYEDPNKLRTHTRTQHANDRVSKIEFAMRPPWMHEVFKVDVDNLFCTVCCLPVATWSDMLNHLKDQHSVSLELAYKRVIPYNLQHLKCVSCDEGFTSYKQIDSHMNIHYDNYMCSECGGRFMTSFRLKQHGKVHETAKFKCQYCPKVFVVDKSRKRHEYLTHEHEPEAIFKCFYCDERFSREYTRHQHILEHHAEETTIYCCGLCSETFTWQPFYIEHMKKKHDWKNQRYECELCDKSYHKNYKLQEHMLKHTGEKYMCTVCKKQYTSKTALRHHANKVHKNK